MKSAAKLILYTLLNTEANTLIVRSTLGSGPFARQIGPDPLTQKIILPGDNAAAVAQALFLLLDVSVDLQMDDSVRDDLRQEFRDPSSMGYVGHGRAPHTREEEIHR